MVKIRLYGGWASYLDICLPMYCDYFANSTLLGSETSIIPLTANMATVPDHGPWTMQFRYDYTRPISRKSISKLQFYYLLGLKGVACQLLEDSAPRDWNDDDDDDDDDNKYKYRNSSNMEYETIRHTSNHWAHWSRNWRTEKICKQHQESIQQILYKKQLY